MEQQIKGNLGLISLRMDVKTQQNWLSYAISHVKSILGLKQGNQPCIDSMFHPQKKSGIEIKKRNVHVSTFNIIWA